MSKRYLNLASWNRREHFEFFSQFAEPFHGMTVTINCDQALAYCREQQQSFFLFYLHRALRAVNQTEALRLRIEPDAAGRPTQVVDYQRIHVNCTVARADHSFGFCAINYHPDFAQFAIQAQAAMAQVKASTGLCLSPTERTDVVHFSAIPWLNFTALSHARPQLQTGICSDSVPKISVGKLSQQADGKTGMPVALFAHHGLADAYHFAQFYECLEQGLRSFEV